MRPRVSAGNNAAREAFAVIACVASMRPRVSAGNNARFIAAALASRSRLQ
mgnify:CR=1 FL=1